MQQNTSFFSLSGLSAILLGIYGLLTVYVVHMLTSTYGDGFDGSSQLPIALLEIVILVLAVIMILISLITVRIRAKRRSKKSNEKLWNPLSKKLRLHTLIPLLLFIIVLVIIANKGYYSYITPLLLLLYGMFLLNLSRFSSGSIKYLAVAEIMLAITSYFLYDKEMLFLGLGFGIFHIIYGLITFSKKATVN
jgi:Na+/melibiose symporter-like transporter